MSRLNIITKIFSATGFFLACYMTAPASAAQDRAPANTPEIRLDTPSGLPVPRLVSLKAKKTFCRSGPSFAHPVRLTFMRQGLPVMVVAETTDYWRKIRDLEGDECWTHKSKLSGIETALVLEDGLPLRARPEATAPAKARLGRGVITKVEEERDGWLRVTANGRKGWARASAFWGARAQMPLGTQYSSAQALNIAATHN
ncbi:SH3 domain-containing protein [Hyphococcus formosus]|uniref:SH3 domain-containing protein n=1 Tax=Hyphococcus formosus TaxID=3143534 RepID=UPI00398B293A